MRVDRARARVDEVADYMVEESRLAGECANGDLKHRIIVHNLDQYREKLGDAVKAIKRAAYRMSQRRANESIMRWAERTAAGSGPISLEQLRAEVQRRADWLDASETEAEKAMAAVDGREATESLQQQRDDAALNRGRDK